jgi:dolichol-phosphate mannosyltransferase
MFTSDTYTSEAAGGTLSRAPSRGETELTAPVTVIIPCFNEEEGLPSLLERLRAMRAHPACADWQFLFVDDGSTDRTFTLLLQAARSCPWIEVIRHHSNLGLGAALRTGFAHTRSPIVCTMDSDCTYPPERLPELTALVAGGADLATASPWHPGNKEAEGTALRVGLSRAASLLYRYLLGQEVHTFTCLFRAYRRSSIERLRFRGEGFSAVAEILLRALLLGRRIAEVPMPLEVRRFGESKLNVSDAVMGHMRLMTRTLAAVGFRQLARLFGR